MPVSFSEMVARLSADERKLLDNTFSKYPELKDDWINAKEDGLRLADYSRKLNEFTAKEKEFETAKSEQERWEAWAEKNVPIWEGLAEKGIIDKETGEELWTKQKSELETQLAEARKQAVAGADMKPEELDARVKEIVKQAGGVTPDELKALIMSEGKKLAEETFKEQWSTKETDFNSKTIPFVAGFAAATSVVANRFEKETGEQWTVDRQKEMFDLMSKEQNFDPFKVEEKILAPFRDKKARAEEIRVEAEKLAKTMRAETGGGEERYIPQDGEGKGALKAMLERSAGESTDFTGLINDQARKAAAELRAEGKG